MFIALILRYYNNKKFFMVFFVPSIIAVLCSGVLYSYTVTVQEEAEQRTAYPVRDS